MVRLEKNKIVIEITTDSPFEELGQIKTSLLDSLSILDPKFEGKLTGILYYVSWLINEMDIEQHNIESILNDVHVRDLIVSKLSNELNNKNS